MSRLPRHVSSHVLKSGLALRGASILGSNNICSNTNMHMPIISLWTSEKMLATQSCCLCWSPRFHFQSLYRRLHYEVHPVPETAQQETAEHGNKPKPGRNSEGNPD